MMPCSTKSGSLARNHRLGTTFGAIQHLCQMVLCRKKVRGAIRGAVLHCISSTKMVLNSTNSGSLARKEPLKGLNRFFVRQWCYIAT